ncbi:MAG: hypothetical protein QXR88_01725 [Candidatus Pacearchaeota archaeon]
MSFIKISEIPTKYPKLPPELDKRRKLMPEDIKEIRRLFNELITHMTERQAILKLAEEYGVSYATIYYWTHDKYRKEKRKKNVLTKAKWWEKHGRDLKKEVELRKERWERFPQQKIWHFLISTKNEKRCKRHTFYGIPFKKLLKKIKNKKL